MQFFLIEVKVLEKVEWLIYWCFHWWNDHFM